jgi:hypothetical protein
MIDIKSINFGTFDREKGIFTEGELTPTLKIDYRGIRQDQIREYEVLPWQEMRMDLVINSIYGEDQGAQAAIDVVMALNFIDNPLNIKAGMIIKYPDIESIDDFRYKEVNFTAEKERPANRFLGKADKNTRIDSKRKTFLENNYALPPTVNKVPINPVRIENGKFVMGGVK